MNQRLSRLVADWLAHPTGILQAVITTALFLATPFVFGWSVNGVIFWYLAYCTFISFATQFTIAFQNEQARHADDLQLRNQTHTMELIVALAKEIRGEQDENQQELLAQLKDLAEDLDLEQLDKITRIQTLVEKVTPTPPLGETSPGAETVT